MSLVVKSAIWPEAPLTPEVQQRVREEVNKRLVTFSPSPKCYSFAVYRDPQNHKEEIAVATCFVNTPERPTPQFRDQKPHVVFIIETKPASTWEEAYEEAKAALLPPPDDILDSSDDEVIDPTQPAVTPLNTSQIVQRAASPPPAPRRVWATSMPPISIKPLKQKQKTPWLARQRKPAGANEDEQGLDRLILTAIAQVHPELLPLMNGMLTAQGRAPLRPASPPQ